MMALNICREALQRWSLAAGVCAQRQAATAARGRARPAAHQRSVPCSWHPAQAAADGRALPRQPLLRPLRGPPCLLTHDGHWDPCPLAARRQPGVWRLCQSPGVHLPPNPSETCRLWRQPPVQDVDSVAIRAPCRITCCLPENLAYGFPRHVRAGIGSAFALDANCSI